MRRGYFQFSFLYLVAAIFLVACGVSELFGRAGSRAEAELEGIVWVLEANGDQRNPQPVVEGSSVTLQFDFSEGRVYGNGGCNSYSASFDVNGSDLTISPAMSTLMACFPEALMNQETAYHQKLSRAEWYEVGGGKLSIYTSDDQILVFSSQ